MRLADVPKEVEVEVEGATLAIFVRETARVVHVFVLEMDVDNSLRPIQASVREPRVVKRVVKIGPRLLQGRAGGVPGAGPGEKKLTQGLGFGLSPPTPPRFLLGFDPRGFGFEAGGIGLLIQVVGTGPLEKGEVCRRRDDGVGWRRRRTATIDSVEGRGVESEQGRRRRERSCRCVRRGETRCTLARVGRGRTHGLGIVRRLRQVPADTSKLSAWTPAAAGDG